MNDEYFMGLALKEAEAAFDEGEVSPLFWGYFGLYFIQIVLVAGGEVVQAGNFLV